MKKILFTILFLTSLTALSAQLQDSFLLVGSAGTFSALTDSTFRGTVTFQSDQFGSGYLPTGIQTNYKLIDAKGDIFTITAVNSSNFTTANIDVEEDDADRTAPAGIVMVFAVLPSGLYPVAPVNSTGISPIMEARLHMANVITRGVGLDVGTMTDSLNTIRDSLAAIEAELEAARTDSLDRIRDSINAVLSIPEKLPSQNITVSAPSYTLRYDTINQHIVITNNSQAYRSVNGNIIISSEMGKTDIVGREFEINTDSLTDFTGRTVLNDKISGVIVENDAGEIRRSGTIIPFTDSLSVSTITSIDLGYRYKARYKLNCSSDPEIITLDLSNPISGGVYTFRFFGVVDSITVAFSHQEDDETSKATFGVSNNQSKTFVFDSDGNYFLVPSGEISTTTTTTSANYSVLDTIVTSADWNPLNTLLDDYDFISVTIQSESGDPSNAQFGLPTPTASLSDLEIYVHAWDEDGTRNPVISAGSGTLWYDSTSTSTSVSLLNGHTYRLHVDQTTGGSWIWVLNDLTGDVSATGGIWEQENTNTLASANTTDNYHEGNIGVGDFSGTTIGATIHAHDVTNVRLRLSDQAANDTLAQAYVEYYRGYATSKLGQIGYTDNTDLDLHIENHLTGGGLEFRTDNVEKMKLFADGQLRLNYYGDSIYTGTATKYLAVDADGFVIEADAGGASITSFTPDGTEDTSGDEGDLAYDDDYIYVKTSAGWKRGALSTFISSTFINVDTMPDLLLWLVADSLILANNDPVSTWTDESGNGNDYAQSGSARPTYKTNVVNGKAVVDFDGTDDYLRISDLDVTSDSVEAFVVYYTDTYDSSGGFALIGGSADSSSYNLGVSGSGGGNGTHFITRHSTGNSIARDGTAATTGEWLIANGNYNQVQTELIINGTSEGTNAQTAALLNPAQPEFIGAYFGGVGPIIVGPFDGKIAEIIVFTAYLSTARRTQVKNYLAKKYGITVN